MKFPKVLYVRVADGGSGGDFFVPYENKECNVEVGETMTVAVYELVHKLEVKGYAEAKLKLIKRKKK